MADQDDIKRPGDDPAPEGETPTNDAEDASLPEPTPPADNQPEDQPEASADEATEASAVSEPETAAAGEASDGDELDAATAAALAAAQEAVAIATGATKPPAASAPAGSAGEASKTGPISDADIAAAMATAKLERAIDEQAEPLRLPDFAPGANAGGEGGQGRFDLLNGVNLNVKIELGRTRMLLEDVLRLTEGAVVELDKLAGDPVDVFVNERHVARGEVLVLNDNFCVRINEIVDTALESQRGSARASG